VAQAVRGDGRVDVGLDTGLLKDPVDALVLRAPAILAHKGRRAGGFEDGAPLLEIPRERL